MSRQVCRQFSLKKELPVEEDDTAEEDSGIADDDDETVEEDSAVAEEEDEVIDDELADCFAEEELADDSGAFSEEDVADTFSEEELDAFAEEERATDEELSDFFDEELDTTLADELRYSFPSSSYTTYVTLLELSEHAIKASEATATIFKNEDFFNKLKFMINLLLYNRNIINFTS